MSNDIYFAEIEGKEYQIEIVSNSIVNINGTQYSIDYEPLKLGSSCSLLVNGNSFEPNTFQENGGWEILLKGRRFKVKVEDERERRLRLASGQSEAQTGRIVVQSPMPGLVIDIPVQEGDQVEEGEVLVILESMKMQNELRALRAGRITRIHAAVNDNVERKETLLTME
jgi:biotin carboxyl carrier protein